MATIGKLNVGLQVTTEKFSKGLSTAQGGVASFASRLNALNPAILGFAGIIGGKVVGALGDAAQAMVGFVTDGIGRVDDLGDFAAQLGLSAGALAKLRHMAQFTGGDVGAMGKAVQKLNVNLGAGKIDDTLKEIGLSGDKLRGMSIDAAFIEISGAIEKIDSPSQKAKYAMELLGKSGLNVISTLAAGPSKLRELGAEAEKFGVAVSDVDADNIGEAQDAIDRMKKTFEGVSNTLAASFAPLITMALEKLVSLIPASSTIKGAMAVMFTGIGKALGFVLDGLNMFSLGWMNVKAVAALAAADLVQSLSFLGDAYVEIIRLIEGREIANPLKEMEGSFRTMATTLNDEWQKELLKPLPSAAINKWFADLNKTANSNAGASLKSTPSSALRLQREQTPVMTNAKFANALTLGSAEARNLEIKTHFGNKVAKNSTEEKLLANNTQQLSELQLIRRAAERQVRAMEEDEEVDL